MNRSAPSKTKNTAPAPTRVLIVSHSHPSLAKGGAEIAAYDLFKTLEKRDDISPFFVAGVRQDDRPAHTGTAFQQIADVENELLFWGADFNYFLQSQQNKASLYHDFKVFLLEQKPDIIHFHHTMRIGLEALQIAKQTLPHVKIVYTLHEFILMCHNDGQMVCANTQALCESSSPARCHQCFPSISAGAFKAREIFIKTHLELVDQFIAPSKFLATRFAQWGIPAHKLLIIENGIRQTPPAPFRSITHGSPRNVFGFFGQITPYKGASLALEAAKQLHDQGFSDFHLHIFGSAHHANESFHAALQQAHGNVHYHGEYDPHQLPALMALVDWVIVPSTWWENSPLVIQEALMHKRPVITSDIGGMAEKVQHNVTGLHFKALNAQSLASVMKQACTERDAWQSLMEQIPPRLSIEESTELHSRLYAHLLTTR